MPDRTKLTREQEKAYQKWRAKLPKPLQYEGDYDLRGLFKENPKAKPSSNLHFPDTYKLPNHPTFSNESIYFTSLTKNQGGFWQETDSSFNYIPYNPLLKDTVIERKMPDGGKINNMPDNKKPKSVDSEYEKARAARILQLSREWGVPTNAIFSQVNRNASGPVGNIAPGASVNYWTFDPQGNVAKSITDRNPLPLGQSPYTAQDIQLQQRFPGQGMTTNVYNLANDTTAIPIAQARPLEWGGSVKGKKKKAQFGTQLPDPNAPYGQYFDETVVPLSQDIQRMTYLNDVQPVYGNNPANIDTSLQNTPQPIPLQNSTPSTPDTKVGGRKGRGINFGSVNINLGAAITGLAGAANQAFQQANAATEAARNQRLTLQQETFNPFQYGIQGSQALFKDGGKVPNHVYDLSKKDIERLKSMGYTVEKVK